MWIDLNKLNGIDEEFADILKTSKSVDEQRKDILCSTLNMRIGMLKNVMEQRVKYTNIQAIGDEVEEDIAYSGNDNGMTMQ